MSGAELALGIIGAVDVCCKWGKGFLRTCQAFRDADTRLSESIVRVENCWFRIESQIQIVPSLASLMDDRHREVQQRTLEILSSKLQAADSKLAGLIKPSSSSPNPRSLIVDARRFKYAFVKDSLAETISELEAWQAIFDPSWFLLMKIVAPEVDSQLNATAKQQVANSRKGSSSTSISVARNLRRALKSDDEAPGSTIFLPQDGLIAHSIRVIPLSPVSTAQRAHVNQAVLLDPVTCANGPSVNAVLKDIRNFARRLRHADPHTFGLLECKGILKHDSEDSDKTSTSCQLAPRYSFVFRMPSSHSEIQSVRHRLLRGSDSEHDSLSGRFDLARQLVRAVNYVHIYGFVHKNIRPETVLVLSKGCTGSGEKQVPGETELSETAVLVGFDVLRNADGRTRRLGDEDWEKNLYRHPQRQGRNPESDFEMRHDIYSVGVCLLEIGLWESFVVYDADGSGGDTASQTARPGSGLGLDSTIQSGPELLKDPSRLLDRFLVLARGRLRHKMGTRYSKVVETCLTCLDSDNEDFGDEEEFQDEDGVAVGVRYIEKVVAKLGEIVV